MCPRVYIAEVAEDGIENKLVVQGGGGILQTSTSSENNRFTAFIIISGK